MLARPHRLTAKRDFERASRQGRPVHAPCITVRAVANRLPQVRVWMVIGLKISKRSNVRNRAKRLLREIFRRHIAAIHPGIDIVVHVKPTIIGVPYAALAAEVGRTLHRGGMLVKPWVDSMGNPKENKASGEDIPKQRT